MSRLSSPLTPIWLMAATMSLSACQLVNNANTDRASAPIPDVHASCGSTLDRENTAQISGSSTGSNGEHRSVIHVQMAWQEDEISRRYFDADIDPDSLTQAQAQILADAHCADADVGRAFNLAGFEAAMRKAQVVMAGRQRATQQIASIQP